MVLLPKYTQTIANRKERNAGNSWVQTLPAGSVFFVQLIFSKNFLALKFGNLLPFGVQDTFGEIYSDHRPEQFPLWTGSKTMPGTAGCKFSRSEVFLNIFSFLLFRFLACVAKGIFFALWHSVYLYWNTLRSSPRVVCILNRIERNARNNWAQIFPVRSLQSAFLPTLASRVLYSITFRSSSRMASGARQTQDKARNSSRMEFPVLRSNFPGAEFSSDFSFFSAPDQPEILKVHRLILVITIDSETL